MNHLTKVSITVVAIAFTSSVSFSAGPSATVRSARGAKVGVSEFSTPQSIGQQVTGRPLVNNINPAQMPLSFFSVEQMATSPLTLDQSAEISPGPNLLKFDASGTASDASETFAAARGVNLFKLEAKLLESLAEGSGQRILLQGVNRRDFRLDAPAMTNVTETAKAVKQAILNGTLLINAVSDKSPLARFGNVAITLFLGGYIPKESHYVISGTYVIFQNGAEKLVYIRAPLYIDPAKQTARFDFVSMSAPNETPLSGVALAEFPLSEIQQ